ncbi:MAG: hypothetical protein EYC70_10290 [Planctomycetota bacterium]|nr:MAG: hypothetical protein EYC70_10290 [Planctomycetota bacterium]
MSTPVTGVSAISASARPEDLPGDRYRFLREEAMQALEACLDAGDAVAVPPALKALARVTPAPGSVAPRLRQRLGGQAAEAEAAVLALGLWRDPQAMEWLLELFQDGGNGRKLVQGSEVAPRLRTIAAFALGLHAARNDSPGAHRYFGEMLLAQLDTPERTPLELQAACAVTLRMLEPADPSDWTERLLEWLEAERHPVPVRAHFPGAVAMLLDGGRFDAAQGDAVARLSALLAGATTAADVRASCAQALGRLVTAGSPFADRVCTGLLAAAQEDSDARVRAFAAISLAYLGGSGGPGSALAEERVIPFLLQHMRRGATGMRPWCALALGVLCTRSERAGKGSFSSALARAVAEHYDRARSPSERGACAVALGLMRYDDAAPGLRRALLRPGDEAFRAHCALSLGLMNAHAAQDDLRRVLEDAGEQPLLLRDAGMALALLGDATVLGRLTRRVPDSPHGELPPVSSLVAAAFGLRHLGDPMAAQPLLRVLADVKAQPVARAVAAEAVGPMLDPMLPPLRSRLAQDLNYHVALPTLFEPWTRTGVLDQL